MPASPTPDPLVAALRNARLLAEDQLAELDRWAAEYRPEPAVLGAEVVRRGWLTAYQVRQVLRGRGAELTLGPYRLTDLIGQGGMGRVYKARHTRLGRDAAVKIIKKERLTKPAMVDRFRQEIRSAAQLAHPNVVLALDADEADGTHYFAMEYVDGTDLSKLVKEKGPLPAVVACEYVRQAAAGLQHAHDRGLIHRDVKPGNLLVTPKGVVKVLDLGLALLAGDPSQVDQQTPDRYLIGTPDYIAPEQVRNPLAVDARADVYALGGTLYYLLTGAVPYPVESATDKLVKQLNAPPPSPAAVRPDLPPGLDAAVRAMMAKKPDDRPASAAAVVQLLAPFSPTRGGHNATGGDEFAFTEPAPKSRANKPARRNRVWAVVAGLVGVGAVIGVGAALRFGDRSSASEPAAEFVNGIGMKLVRLPGGTVVLGSPADEPGRQPGEPATTEAIVPGPFYVSATEVTHGQFQAVVGRSPAVWPRKLRQGQAVAVDSVTWAEADEFCRRLTDREPARPGWAYRLPTETEWEYACRAGTQTAFWSGPRLTPGRQAVFNPDDDPHGQADPARGGRPVEKGVPHPAGTGGPNPFGLFDTSGGVWEWVADAGPGGQRVVRGGSWREPPANCRSASRRLVPPDERRDDVGFRVVYAPQK